ncbi:hypothetical protein KKF82_05035 [Patescibacteria group bacterium]|nr:hypothetical protein [Patescibacteria group bacterium]
MWRLMHFSNYTEEYVVLTDDQDADAEEWLMPGYELNHDLSFTPKNPVDWFSLPLEYELHRKD